jgi:hypothetical protein
MSLLNKIAISNGNKLRKEKSPVLAATGRTPASTELRSLAKGG